MSRSHPCIKRETSLFDINIAPFSRQKQSLRMNSPVSVVNGMDPGDGVSGSLYPNPYNEPLTPSPGLIPRAHLAHSQQKLSQLQHESYQKSSFLRNMNRYILFPGGRYEDNPV